MSEKKFWVGPYNIRADEQVYQVPSLDGVNWIDRDGAETDLRGGGPLMGKHEYLQKYGTKDEEGHYWYIPKQINCCGGDGSRPACCK